MKSPQSLPKRLLALVLLTLMVFGCVSTSYAADHNEPGALPIVNEPLKFTIGVQQNSTVQDFETNMMTQYLEEKTGIELEFVVYPTGELQTKLELIIAAGGDELPDILLYDNLSQTILMPWAEAGMIIPLTEYYDSLAHWVHESIAYGSQTDYETIMKYVTSYDGEVYGMYDITESINNQYSGSRMLIYRPWLDALGLDVPTTTEEFYEYLCLVRDTDLNGNGIDDEIPLTAYKDATLGLSILRKFLMTPFIYTQDNYWTVTDGVIGTAVNQDGWREGLRYVNRLYKEGLMDTSLFTQDQATLTVTLSQDPFVVGSYARFSTTNMPATDANRYQFFRMEQLTGPDGETRTSVSPTIPTLSGFVTKNCEHPEIAFMLLDYLNSVEMSTINRYGYEGISWEYNTDIEAEQQKLLDWWAEQDVNFFEQYYGDSKPVVAKYKYDSTLWGQLQNYWWALVGPTSMLYQLDNDFYNLGNVDTEWDAMVYESEFLGKAQFEDAAQYRNNDLVVAGLQYNKEEQETMTQYFTELVTYIEEMWAAFVTGSMDIEDDKAWNNYVTTLENMGMQQCIEATQSCYDRMNGK